MEFKANNDNMFRIPCVVVDNFLQIASSDHIKVLLYILRRSGRDFAENEISDETGVSQEEVDKAIDFWRCAKILTAVPENSSEQKIKKYREETLSGAEIAEIKTSDPEMSGLFEGVENLLGIINPSYANLIIRMHNDLGLKKEVIYTLIDYCKSIGKTYPKYIEAIAHNWSEENINTLQLAQKEVERLMSKFDYTTQIKRITEAERISKKDESIIEQWHKWNIAFELIEKAYDNTIGSIHKLSFPYMNKIIASWHEHGINDLESANNETSTYKKKVADKYKTLDDEDFDVEMYNIFMNDFEVI